MMALQDAADAQPVGSNPQVVYDIWNEPGPDAPVTGVPGSYRVPYDEIVAIIDMIKAIRNDRTTVGFARVEGNATLLSFMINPANLDVVSHHPYGLFEAVIQQELADAQAIANGRPVVATEAVYHGACQDAAHVLTWFERAGEGFFVWEAFASETPFLYVGGLFYADPPAAGEVKVRDLEGVNKLLAMAVNNGFEPTHVGVLKLSSDPGFIPYAPTPYEFTAPKGHDLLVNWQTQYGIAYPPLSLNDNGASWIFHSQLLTWATVSLGKLNLLTPTDVDFVLAASANAIQAWGLGDLPGAELELDAVAGLFGPKIASNQLAEPLNTPPEAVYLRATPNPYVPGAALDIDLVVNDADRIDDLILVQLYYSDGVIPYEEVPITSHGNGHYSFHVDIAPVLPPGTVISLVGGALDKDFKYDLAFEMLY